MRRLGQGRDLSYHSRHLRVLHHAAATTAPTGREGRGHGSTVLFALQVASEFDLRGGVVAAGGAGVQQLRQPEDAARVIKGALVGGQEWR
ncbi:hypothetical protein E2C01_028340 [Portunus trituberculatus]|uniref:Uncharacterized protein n=1 Tax=Portunus trituberculatus TaxID=210409 RepID=A0A5B7ENS3_PORTR|nr:hypothetical protein [Portunus trituberculatus]